MMRAAQLLGASRTKFAALMVALVLLLPVTSWLVVRVQGPQVERDAYDHLTAIAKLKAEQVETWLAERHRDGHVLATDPDFVRQVLALATRPSPGDGASDAMVVRFNQLRHVYDYDSLALLDLSGRVLVSAGPPAASPASFGAVVLQVQERDQLPPVEVLVGADDAIQLRWWLPVFDSSGPLRRLLALVLVHSSPQHFLFPVIQTWPTSSPSGETLLVTREGDSAVFMNTLRHRSGTAMKLRLPMADLSLPAAVALKASLPDVVTGLDYRRVEVMSAYRPVAGTAWRVVAKLDRSEVMAPVRVLSLWVGGVTALALLAVTAVLALLWRQARRAQRLEVLAAQAKSDELMARFFSLPFIGIATGDVASARWGRVNDHFLHHHRPQPRRVAPPGLGGPGQRPGRGA